MKDREQNQNQGLQLPPVWCSSICRNAMNDVCIEHCAIERDCSKFEEKPNLELEDMPRFPETAGMTKEEKFTSVTIYLAKVVDNLQGVQNEKGQHYIRTRRPDPNRSRCIEVLENIQGEDLPLDQPE